MVVLDRKKNIIPASKFNGQLQTQTFAIIQQMFYIQLRNWHANNGWYTAYVSIALTLTSDCWALYKWHYWVAQYSTSSPLAERTHVSLCTYTRVHSSNCTNISIIDTSNLYKYTWLYTHALVGNYHCLFKANIIKLLSCTCPFSFSQ